MTGAVRLLNVEYYRSNMPTPKLKKKKVIKAWAVVRADGSLFSGLIYEGCPSCEPCADGYQIYYSKANAERMKWKSMGHVIKRVSIIIE